MVYLCRLALTQDVTVGIYWIYLCLYWIQCITSVVLAILIATNKNEDGPTFLVKLSFLVGVFFSLPGDVPSFIWSCISYSDASIGYCFALAFSFLSVLFLFIALRAEFLRLKQEAQYHAIGGEVGSLFSVHSETITASWRKLEQSKCLFLKSPACRLVVCFSLPLLPLKGQEINILKFNQRKKKERKTKWNRVPFFNLTTELGFLKLWFKNLQDH